MCEIQSDLREKAYWVLSKNKTPTTLIFGFACLFVFVLPTKAWGEPSVKRLKDVCWLLRPSCWHSWRGVGLSDSLGFNCFHSGDMFLLSSLWRPGDPYQLWFAALHSTGLSSCDCLCFFQECLFPPPFLISLPSVTFEVLTFQNLYLLNTL